MKAHTNLQTTAYKDEMDEVAKQRDEFISVIAHELKTPVTSVKMYTEILKKHSETTGDMVAVTHLTKLDKQINKLTTLIYDILNVSKIKADRMDFKQTLFDFDQEVEEVVDFLKDTSGNRTILIKGKTEKKILGDIDRIGQVLHNILSNAIKYSPTSKKIVVSLRSTMSNVFVAIQDFGIGIDAIHHGKIFERFYRVGMSEKTFPGLGIGLYISNQIVLRHGGKMWVESTPGKGSTFYFSLPIQKKNVF